jgi:curved DNA-binding protein CbpA
MTPRGDPYRVLGLVAGASVGEIRSAYRRLAKLHHPDTAGDRSLPRFLAIQAAYEELVDGEGRLRIRGWPAKGTAASARTSTRATKGASRDAWRARRADGRGDAESAASPGPSAGGTSRKTGAADARKSKPSGEDAGRTGRGAAPPGGQRQRHAKGAGHATGERRTAYPGSTTYDEAAQPLDPSWSGSTWYGASSGRYWTLNPREYADPRKHGPEYQERARRASNLEAQRLAGVAGGDAAEGPPSSRPARSVAEDAAEQGRDPDSAATADQP